MPAGFPTSTSEMRRWQAMAQSFKIASTSPEPAVRKYTGTNFQCSQSAALFISAVRLFAAS